MQDAHHLRTLGVVRPTVPVEKRPDLVGGQPEALLGDMIERAIRKDPLLDEALEASHEASDERRRGVTSHRARAAEGIGDLLHLGERDLWRHRGVHTREHEEFPAALLKGVGALFGHVRVEIRAQLGQPGCP